MPYIFPCHYKIKWEHFLQSHLPLGMVFHENIHVEEQVMKADVICSKSYCSTERT